MELLDSGIQIHIN